MSLSLASRLRQTLRAIRKTTTSSPSVGIVLGTGLANLLRGVRHPVEIPYPSLPHMPRSTAPTHRGQMVFGTLSRTPVVIMDGRFHLYEGYSAEQVVYPIRVMKSLGVKTLLIANVAGGLNKNFHIGDLMLVTDHLNLLGTSPLVGPNDEKIGPRFPDMSQPYDAELLKIAKRVGQQERLPLCEGVYAAMLGPQLETKAEYRWLRAMGADAVGMSTVPEVIAAVHAGLRVLTVSLISDLCIPETLKPVSIEEIIAVAERAEPLLTTLFVGVVRALEGTPRRSSAKSARK